MCCTTELPKPLLELVELRQQQIDNRRSRHRQPLGISGISVTVHLFFGDSALIF
jgi:hypothetical protein